MFKKLKSYQILVIFSVVLTIISCENPLGQLEQVSDDFCGGLSTTSNGSCSEISRDASLSLDLVSGAYQFSNGEYAQSCKDYKDSSAYAQEGDGLYRINPGGLGAIEAMCDMTTNDGGWTLVAIRRRDNTNREDCGGSLNDFFSNTCGDVTALSSTSSYSIGNSALRSAISSDGLWAFHQYDSADTLDLTDSYIIQTSNSDLFPSSTGTLNQTLVDGVCDYNLDNCDTASAYFLWVGDGWFSSSNCNGVYESNGVYKGNYGYCHNGLSAGSNNLFGERQQYGETKLWGWTASAGNSERIWVR